jgi:hypothetical protein
VRQQSHASPLVIVLARPSSAIPPIPVLAREHYESSAGPPIVRGQFQTPRCVDVRVSPLRDGLCVSSVLIEAAQCTCTNERISPPRPWAPDVPESRCDGACALMHCTTYCARIFSSDDSLTEASATTAYPYITQLADWTSRPEFALWVLAPLL